MSDFTNPVRDITRPCNGCTLCCKTVAVVELDKPVGKWCEHARPKEGRCAIYDDRPASCGDFYCLWATGLIPEDLWPKKTRVVARARVYNGRAIILLMLDPDRPDEWRHPRWQTRIKRWIHIKKTPVYITTDGLEITEVELL